MTDLQLNEGETYRFPVMIRISTDGQVAAAQEIDVVEVPDTVAPATVKLALGNALVALRNGETSIERLACEDEDGDSVLSWPALARHLPATS